MRLGLLKIITIFLFLFLILSLAFNQIIKGPAYFQLSQNNRIKLIGLSAPRGSIFDRKDNIIAGRRASFNVALLLHQMQDVNQTLDKIGTILDVSWQGLLRQYKNNLSLPFVPVVVAYDIPKEKAIALECRESEIPGLVIQTEPVRDYLYEEDCCHLLGYLGRVTEDELNRFKQYGLQVTDLIGKGGIEEKFDQYLRGQPGGMQVEVNNRGYQVRILGKKLPQEGTDLHLTIDVQLQKFVNSLLDQNSGTCIVISPENGEILALVSKPGFRPSEFLDALNAKPGASRKIKDLLSAQEAPIFNRAISGTYPPGSIFKIVVAAAGLEAGKIMPKDRFFCPGSFKVGNRDFFCWNLEGHGSEDIYTALAHSCNVFFYKLGISLGADNLTHFARKFGLGSSTDIDLPYESKGLVPSKGWKLKNFKEKWYDGETANFAIGQGYLLATPLQIAQMISVVANGGYLVQPHIVKKIGEQQADILRKKVGFKKETLEIIKQGMRQVIDTEGGTGHKAKIAGVQWAAKTGTAQTPSGRAHGWFAGFYPLDQPEILVLVLLEHGGSGGEAPALIAKQIVEYVRKQDVGAGR